MIKPIVISGPSGSGKSTILNKAFEHYPNAFAFSVSHTTRKARPGEKNGIDYWFISTKEMEQMIENGHFLEHAQFGGNFYGTSNESVFKVQKSGRICILDVNLLGVLSIKKSSLNAKYILVRTFNMEELEIRLKTRGTETDESLKKRLLHAQEDLDAVTVQPNLFDHVIINDHFDTAYKEFISTIDEELKAFNHSRISCP